MQVKFRMSVIEAVPTPSPLLIAQVLRDALLDDHRSSAIVLLVMVVVVVMILVVVIVEVLVIVEKPSSYNHEQARNAQT